jgi:hypothetical protein
MIKSRRSSLGSLCIKLLLVALPIAAGLYFFHNSSSDVGRTFVILDNEYVPLFSRRGTRFAYECGANGTSCRDLNTVLPPGTFVKIIGRAERGTVPVVCKVSSRYSASGFVHQKLFGWAMREIAPDVFMETAPDRHVPSMAEIEETINACVTAKIQYSWGCNNLKEINLGSLYTFIPRTRSDWKAQYRCVGADSAGFLHMISGWTLPHGTELLSDASTGRCVCRLSDKDSDDELQNALNCMRDTDFVVRPVGRVIVFWHGGFMEINGKNGLTQTDRSVALEALKALLKNGNGMIVRWHPDVLAEENCVGQ